MDLEQRAVEMIKLASKTSFRYYQKPITVTYSGGKDSDVMLHLFEISGEPFEVHNSHTTVDAPETVYHIRKTFKRLEEKGIRCRVCGNGIPFYEAQGKIDRKIDLIKRMQAEMDHRAEVEEKAVQLITEGRHGEAVALLNSLDDSVIAGMQEEFEEIEAAGGKRGE